MLSQKGQAFSVFELMIAGVVAFAILIILLMVIGGVGTQAYSDAKTVISNAIKTASPSGQTTTTDFVLKKGESIETVDLSAKTDLDAKGIFFALGEFKSGTDIAVSGDGAAVTYTGSTQKKLAARVICKQTAQDLDASLGRLNSGNVQYDISMQASSACENVQPCCIVILVRSSK